MGGKVTPFAEINTLIKDGILAILLLLNFNYTASKISNQSRFIINAHDCFDQDVTL